MSRPYSYCHKPLIGFGERLEKLMHENNVRDIDMAKILNVERKSIISYRNNMTSPDVMQLKKICVKFHVTSDYMLFGEKERK